MEGAGERGSQGGKGKGGGRYEFTSPRYVVNG